MNIFLFTFFKYVNTASIKYFLSYHKENYRYGITIQRSGKKEFDSYKTIEKVYLHKLQTRDEHTLTT